MNTTDHLFTGQPGATLGVHKPKHPEIVWCWDSSRPKFDYFIFISLEQLVVPVTFLIQLPDVMALNSSGVSIISTSDLFIQALKQLHSSWKAPYRSIVSSDRIWIQRNWRFCVSLIWISVFIPGRRNSVRKSCVLTRPGHVMSPDNRFNQPSVGSGHHQARIRSWSCTSLQASQ